MAVVYGHSLFGVPVLGNLGTPPPPPQKRNRSTRLTTAPNRIYGQRPGVSDKVSRFVRVWVELDDQNGIAAQTKTQASRAFGFEVWGFYFKTQEHGFNDSSE